MTKTDNLAHNKRPIARPKPPSIDTPLETR